MAKEINKNVVPIRTYLTVKVKLNGEEIGVNNYNVILETNEDDKTQTITVEVYH